MPRQNEMLDNVEIANFEAHVAALLANAGEEPASISQKMRGARDYHTMCGRAAALTVMSQALEAALAGRTDEAAERYRKTLEWFDRSGGQYDRDLERAVVQVGNRIDAIQERSTTIAGEGPPDADCPTCHGDGMIATSAWTDWYDHYEAARADWRTEHPTDSGPSFDASPEAWALVDESPDEPERTTCTDCAGTGQLDRAIEDDIHALLDRTPRDNPSAGRADADAERSGPDPDRVYATEDGKSINAEGEPVWRYSESALVAHREAERAAASGPGLDRVYTTDDGQMMNAEGGPVVILPETDLVAAREAARAAAACTTSGPATATESAATADPGAGVGTPAPKADASEPVGDDHDVVAEHAQDDRGSTADEHSSAVDRAQHAVLELKGRRALEEQYARDRARDDEITQRQRDTPADLDRRAVLPAHVMADPTAFDD